MKIEAVVPPMIEPQAATVKKPQGDLTLGLGAVLKDIRRRRGFTQLEAATAIGLERTSVTNIESGKQALTLAYLQRMADLYRMELTIKLEPKA